jgi:hypothetical protein
MRTCIQLEQLILTQFVVALLAYEMFAAVADPKGRFLPSVGI